MASRKKDIVSAGDILVYSPADLDVKHHDFGVVYEIEKVKINSVMTLKRYKILWNRSRTYDVFSENTLIRKIKEKLIYILK